MKQKSFSILFGIILLAELLACYFSELSAIRYVTKPAICISLLVYLFLQKNIVVRTKKFITLGLLFSLLGDVLLMFTANSELYFMGGLFAFLIAHLMYITAFFKKSLLLSKSILFYIIGLLIYATIMLYFISPNLGELMPYVLIYISAILLLGLVALLRKSIANHRSYLLLLFGALSFITSDSLLSLNKFYTDFALASVWIMLTYGLAQLLIVYAGIAEKE